MNPEFQHILDSFGVSEPTFCMTVGDHGSYLTFDVKKRYKPTVTSEDDPLVILMADNYRESFEKDVKKFIVDVRESVIYELVLTEIIKFYEKNSGAKKPRQSKTYKWIASMVRGYHHPSSEGFIALYRYIERNDSFRFTADATAHRNNVLAILEIMREKYEV